MSRAVTKTTHASAISSTISLSSSMSFSSALSSTSTAMTSPSSSPPLELKRIPPVFLDSQKEYWKILSRVLFYELKFLIDMVQNCVSRRKTVWNQLKSGFIWSLNVAIPFLKLRNLADGLVKVREVVVENLETDENISDLLVYSLLTVSDARLKMLTDRVAVEAGCCWDMAFTHWLVDQSQMQTFAVVGASRMVEWLSRQRAVLTTDSLLRGVMEGISGAGHLRFFNTTPRFSQAYPFLEEKCTVEGLYGRSGYQISSWHYFCLNHIQSS